MISAVRNRPKVLIAGGGVAALEALLALRTLVGHQVDITLLADEQRFVYRPVTVAEAFDRAEARVYSLAFLAAEQGAALVPGSLMRVDGERRTAVTDAGRRLEYDRLVVAIGARGRDSLPGALTFRGRNEVAALRGLLAELESGEARSVAFALPSPSVWPLPLYELALMTADRLRAHDAGEVSITLVTPEREPLELFGPAASQAVEALLAQRTIELRTSSNPVAVHEHSMVLAGGGVVFVERVVTLPVPEGPALAGLPHDRDGFIPVDAHGRVAGAEGVFAAGDATAFPLKQGGLAAQQADAVAEQIAAEFGIPLTPQPFRPVLRGLLMTGGPPLYLRAEPPLAPGHSEFVMSAEPVEAPRREASAATGQPLWWPPAKVAGRYLAPYLANAHRQPLSEELSDRAEVPGLAISDSEQDDALELALLLADLDARWGDYRSALEALDAAEAASGALPPEYEARRRQWRQAQFVNG